MMNLSDFVTGHWILRGVAAVGVTAILMAVFLIYCRAVGLFDDTPDTDGR